MREEVIISDASALIALADIGQLDLLRKLYKKVLITDVVRKEIHADLPDWIDISTEYDLNQFQVLRLELDAGEASAISLASKKHGSIILLDERKGRLIAKRLNLRVTGTLGLVIKAYEAGFIISGKEILNELVQHGLWISEKLRKQVLSRMGESEVE